MPCEEDPPRAIGIVLRNYEELVYVQFLIQCLLRVIDKIGIEQPDSAYLNSPLWDDVVEAAKHAYEVLMKDEDLDALLERKRREWLSKTDERSRETRETRARLTV